jgi:hypothetical protein
VNPEFSKMYDTKIQKIGNKIQETFTPEKKQKLKVQIERYKAKLRKTETYD